MMSDFKIASLTEQQINEILELELEIGINLVAYQIEDNQYAHLSQEVLVKVRRLEKKLGIVLLAYSEKKAA